MRLSFYGGSKTVTGSNYLLEAGGLKILVDCGLFQGNRYSEQLNYEKFKYNASEVNFVFVTHSHADHIGRIPKLYNEGFRGVIYASEPTRALMVVALPDTLDKILGEAREMHHEPLYDKSDVHAVLELVKGIPYRQTVQLNESVAVTLHDSGHILGSSQIEVVVKEDGQEKRLLFTGDMGNPPVPLLQPIDYVKDVDYLVIESAYGDRIHPSKEECRAKLITVIKESVARGGTLMIPSFAIERTQDLMFYLDDMLEKGEIPSIPIFLDSPLAIKITKVYEQFPHYFNKAADEELKKHGGIFKFNWLKFTPTANESKSINDVPPPKIIIAGSGMSNGGRILHHELRYLPDPNSTILFVGYQVKGSLGRRILEKEPQVIVLGEKVAVKCVVESISGFSAHADQIGLVKAVRESNAGRGLKRVFTVQGEDYSARALAVKIKIDLGLDATAPDPDQSFDL